MMEKQSDIIKVPGLPVVVAGFNWSVGFLMEKFIKELANKKILASKCPECGYVHVPPRNRCVRCHVAIGEDDVTELSGKGKLVGWTLARVELDGKGNFRDLDNPKLVGAIKLDGADSTVFMPLGEVDPAKIEKGMSLAPQWSKKTKGEIADIEYFKPE